MVRIKGYPLLIALVLMIFSAAAPALAGSLAPGEPPTVPTLAPQGAIAPAVALPLRQYVPLTVNVAAGTSAGLYVNIQDRQSVLNFYNLDYLGYDSAEMDWTGSQASCVPGTTSAEFQSVVLHRVNYFRAMAGLPANVTFSAEMNRKAQAAALMMSANGQLSHSPPTSWKCYSSDGAAGAGSSDLFLGVYSWDAISGYMLDPGASNSAAGHRRWILYPQTQVMGTGDVPPSGSYYAANALVVIDSAQYSSPRPATRDDFVAWPPPGYVPSPVVYARWSFAYPGADFSAATVSMTSNGAGVSLAQSPVQNGYGENTLVWIPLGMSDGATWPRPASDTSYKVTVSNVKINNVARSFSYTVTIFAP